MTHPKTTRITAGIGVGIVAASAAVIRFHHVQKLARSAGEPELTAWLLPLSIDGAVAAAAAVILADAKARRRPTILTWLMLILWFGCIAGRQHRLGRTHLDSPRDRSLAPIALALGIEVLAAMGRRSVPLPAPQTTTPSRPPPRRRRAVQEALGCGASRATRLIGLARQADPDLGVSA